MAQDEAILQRKLKLPWIYLRKRGSVASAPQVGNFDLGKSGISTWEELLDLGKNSVHLQSGITPLLRCQTSIGSKSTPWGNLRRSPVWHDICEVSGTSLPRRGRADAAVWEPMEDIS